MAQLTDAQLQTEANVIRDETQPNANTANRVGLMLNDIIDSKINKDSIAPLTFTDTFIRLFNLANDSSLTFYWNDNDGELITFQDTQNKITNLKFNYQANNNTVTIPTETGVLAIKVNNNSADAAGNITVTPKVPLGADINISLNDYQMSNYGIYLIVNAGSGTKKIIFPNPSDYLGLTITLINNTASSAPISATNQPLLRGTASAVTTIATGEMWQFISNGTWRGGKLS
jgi:hypothetical protein